MIRRAKVKDLPGINTMMDFYGLTPIEGSILKDLCFVSTRKEKIVGFIWAFFPKSKFLAYIDYLTVMPEGKGDAFRLAKRVLKHLDRIRVKNAFTLVIENGSEHSKQAFKINRKIGLVPHQTPYCFLMEETERMAERWVR